MSDVHEGGKMAQKAQLNKDLTSLFPQLTENDLVMQAMQANAPFYYPPPMKSIDSDPEKWKQIEKKQKPPNFKHIRYNHKNTVANSHDHGRKKTSDENDNTNDVVFARSASAGGYSTNLKNDNDFHTINHNNNDADVEKEDWISVHPLVLRSRGVYLGGEEEKVVEQVDMETFLDNMDSILFDHSKERLRLPSGFELVETDADAHKNDSDIPEWIAKDEGKKLHSFILQVLKDLKTQHKTKYSRCVMDDSDEDSDDQDTHDGNSDGNSDSNTKSTDSGGTGESIKNEHTGSRTHKLKIKKSRGLMKRSTPVKSKHGSRDGVNNTNHRHKNEGNNDDEDTNLASDSGRHYAKIAHSIKYLQERKVQEIQALLLGDGNDDNNLHSANNRKKRNNRRGNVTAINAMNTSGGKEGSVGAENENQKLIGRIQAFARCAIINGKQVWTGERDGSILIRDARTARSVQRIETGDRLVWSLQIVNKTHVWAGTESGPINIYDLKSFKLTQTLNTHAGGVYIIAATAAGVFTGSSDWTIIHWLPDGTQKRMLSDHANSVRSLLCIGSQTLWSGSDDHTIRVWDIPTGQCTHVLEGHTGGVLSLVTTGHTVVSGSEDGTLCVWSLNTSKPQCLKQVACQNNQRVNSLSMMGNHLWSCGQNKEIQVWDAQTLKPINLLKGHSSYVNDLVKIECLETRYVWSFSTGDGSVCVWRTEHSTSQDSGDVFAQTIAEVNDLEGRLQELNERMSEESDKWYFGESRRSLERQEFKRTITGLVYRLASALYGRHEMIGDIERLKRQLREVLRQNKNLKKEVELHLNDHEKDEKVKALLVSRIQSKEEHIRKLNELISLKTDEFERSTTNSKIDLQSAHSRLKQVEADHAALSAQLKKIKGSLRLKEKESAGLTSSVNQLEYGNRELSKELQLDRSEKDLLKKRLAEILHNQDISAEAQTRKYNDSIQANTSLQRENQGLGMSLRNEKEANAALKEAQRKQEAEIQRLARELEKERQRSLKAQRRQQECISQQEQTIHKLLLDNDSLGKSHNNIRHRMDVIAREMKLVHQRLGGLARTQQELVKDPYLLTSFEEDNLECRHHVKDIITQCLLDSQKLHIGVPVDYAQYTPYQLMKRGSGNDVNTNNKTTDKGGGNNYYKNRRAPTLDQHQRRYVGPDVKSLSTEDGSRDKIPRADRHYQHQNAHSTPSRPRDCRHHHQQQQQQQQQASLLLSSRQGRTRLAALQYDGNAHSTRIVDDLHNSQRAFNAGPFPANSPNQRQLQPPPHSQAGKMETQVQTLSKKKLEERQVKSVKEGIRARAALRLKTQKYQRHYR